MNLRTQNTEENHLDLSHTENEDLLYRIVHRIHAHKKPRSFWVLFSYNPDKLYEPLFEMGYTPRTLIISPSEYRVFLERS